MKTIVEHKKTLLELETKLEIETYVADNMSVKEYSTQAIKEVTAFANRLLKNYGVKSKPKSKKKKNQDNQQTIY